jgi:hypothetical protein
VPSVYDVFTSALVVLVLDGPLHDSGIVERLYRESPTSYLYNNVSPVISGIPVLSNETSRGLRGNCIARACGYKTVVDPVVSEGVSSIYDVLDHVRTGAVVTDNFGFGVVFGCASRGCGWYFYVPCGFAIKRRKF